MPPIVSAKSTTMKRFATALGMTRISSPTKYLRIAAHQRPEFHMPGGCVVRFRPGNIARFARHSASKASWPVTLGVGAKGKLRLSMNTKHDEDANGFLSKMHADNGGWATNVLTIDGVPVDPTLPPAEVAKNLSKALSFTVVDAAAAAPSTGEGVRPMPRRGGTVEAAIASATVSPVLGAIALYQGRTSQQVKGRVVQFVLHNTPSLAYSMGTSPTGHCVLTRFGPEDMLRLRQLVGGPVTGIRLVGPSRFARSPSELLSGKSRRLLRGVCIGAVRGTAMLEVPGIVVGDTMEDLARAKKQQASAAQTIRGVAKTRRAAGKKKAPKGSAAVITIEAAPTATAAKAAAPPAKKGGNTTVAATKKPVAAIKKPVAAIKKPVAVAQDGKKQAKKGKKVAAEKEPKLITGGHIIDEASVTRSTALKKPKVAEVHDDDELEFAL